MTGTGSGSGQRIQPWNTSSDWTGDYTAAGVTDIEVWVNALSSDNPINIRLAVQGDGGWFHADTSHNVAIGGGWTKVTLSLSDTFTGHAGNSTIGAALADVTTIQILASAGTPVATGPGTHLRSGDILTANIRFDNIAAIPEPGSFALLGFAGLALLLRRRK